MAEEVDLTAEDLGFEPTALNDEPVPGMEPGDFGAADESTETEPSSEDTQDEAGAAEETEQGSEDAGSTGEEPDTTQEPQGSESTGFVFRGKRYESQEAAENAVAAWEGRLSAADRRINEYWNYVQETERKNAELLADIERLESAAREKPEPEKPKDFAESLDWQNLERLKSYAESQGLDPTFVMMQAMAEHFQEYLGSTIEEKLSGINETLETEKAKSDWERVEDEVFNWAAGAQRDDGTSAYPELDNKSPEFSEEFVNLMFDQWNKIARENPAFGITAHGVDYAYRLTQDIARGLMAEVAGNAGTSPGGGAAPKLPATPDPTVNRNATAEALAGTGGVGAPNPLSQGKPKDGSDLLKQWGDIKNVEVDGHDLGFTS